MEWNKRTIDKIIHWSFVENGNKSIQLPLQLQMQGAAHVVGQLVSPEKQKTKTGSVEPTQVKSTTSQSIESHRTH